MVMLAHLGLCAQEENRIPRESKSGGGLVRTTRVCLVARLAQFSSANWCWEDPYGHAIPASTESQLNFWRGWLRDGGSPLQRPDCSVGHSNCLGQPRPPSPAGNHE